MINCPSLNNFYSFYTIYIVLLLMREEFLRNKINIRLVKIMHTWHKI